MKYAWIAHNKPCLDASDTQSLTSVIKSGWIAEGKVSRELESKIAAYLKQSYAQVTSSGTAALHLALLALNIKKGDEVILSTYACTALLNAINYAGAQPVLADIDEHHLGISTNEIRKKISQKTKVIIVHHAFGFPSDIKQIQSFGIPVIEDCAQSLGTKIQGHPAGSFGEIAVCSFYATKLMTTGYGGMVLTSDKKLAERIQDLTRFDQRKDYKVRYNYALSDLSAALGLNQFKKLPSLIARRREIASQYHEALRYSPFYYWEGKKGDQPNYYRFPMGCLKPSKDLIKVFARQKIQVISPIEPYQLLHRYLGQDAKKFPRAEAIARAVVSLPIHPSLSNAEVTRVCQTLKGINL